MDPEASVQSVWVEWGTPGDSAYGPGVRPVDPLLVDLCLGPLGGPCAQLAPAAAMPGRFDVSLTVQPSATYRLAGMVDGTPVAATVTMPGPFTVTAPLGDTLRVTGALSAELPFRWSAPAATRYLLEARTSAGALAFAYQTGDTSGVVRLFRSPGDTVLVTVRAYDQHAAGFLLSTPATFSAQGIPGFLGGRSAARRYVLLWQ